MIVNIASHHGIVNTTLWSLLIKFSTSFRLRIDAAVAGSNYHAAHSIAHLNENVCGMEEVEPTLTENRENHYYFVGELGINTHSHGFIGN